MNIKVSITFEMWPYQEEFTVSITPEDFKKMDIMVDSITNNLKMRLLSHVRTHHPTIWYNYTTPVSRSIAHLTVESPTNSKLEISSNTTTQLYGQVQNCDSNPSDVG